MTKKKQIYQICLSHADQRVIFVRQNKSGEYFYGIYPLKSKRAKRIATIVNEKLGLCHSPIWLSDEGWSAFPPAKQGEGIAIVAEQEPVVVVEEEQPTRSAQQDIEDLFGPAEWHDFSTNKERR